jgi:hypothetical protein
MTSCSNVRIALPPQLVSVPPNKLDGSHFVAGAHALDSNA